MWLPTSRSPVLSVLFITLPLIASMDCPDDKISQIKTSFKDCLERQKEPLLGLNSTVEGLEGLVCNGLDGLVTGCESVISDLSTCLGREMVDQLVSLHLSSITAILSPMLPAVDIASCEVFQTKVTNIENETKEVEPEPEYSPVTDAATTKSLPRILFAIITLTVLLI